MYWQIANDSVNNALVIYMHKKRTRMPKSWLSMGRMMRFGSVALYVYEENLFTNKTAPGVRIIWKDAAIKYCHGCLYQLFSSSLPTQYSFTEIKIFSGTWGPSSWSSNLDFHRIPATVLLTLFSTSTLSRSMTAPSGRKIRSISRRISSTSHLPILTSTC